MAEALTYWLGGHRYLVLWLAGLVLVACAGCATTENRPDSDLPWNIQQPWETAPTIPGLN